MGRISVEIAQKGCFEGVLGSCSGLSLFSAGPVPSLWLGLSAQSWAQSVGLGSVPSPLRHCVWLGHSHAHALARAMRALTFAVLSHSLALQSWLPLLLLWHLPSFVHARSRSPAHSLARSRRSTVPAPNRGYRERPCLLASARYKRNASVTQRNGRRNGHWSVS